MAEKNKTPPEIDTDLEIQAWPVTALGVRQADTGSLTQKICDNTVKHEDDIIIIIEPTIY